ncbi:MAG: hypothetical protein WCP55_09140, partial [Lentisphaerota bacterium]
VAGKGAGETPAVIRKHADKVTEAAGCEVIYVSRAMASYNRARLIEQKVAFVVPDNQMYLPAMGMDLREHIRGLRHKEETLHLSPSAQAVVLEAIYFGTGVGKGISQIELSNTTTYTPMTLSRVFNELGELDFAEVKDRGRERVLCFREGGRQLWNSAKPYLRSPVRRIAWAPEIPQNASRAGLTALAEYTMLAAPATPVYAVTVSQWKNHYPDRKDEPPPIQTGKSVNVEIWTYFPENCGNAGCVDPLSLYLSLEGTDDARVEGARKKLLENMQW